MTSVDPAVTADSSAIVSVDGRRFSGEIDLDTPVLVGDFVLLESAGSGSFLAQLDEKQASGKRVQVGGVLLATVSPQGELGRVAPAPFADGRLGTPGTDLVLAYQAQQGADMAVGTTRSGSDGGTPALVRRSGFNRHTFMCGQSGSGKTYALGVILEHLLAETGLRLLVIDPNGDFVGLGTGRPGADAEQARRVTSADVRVLRAGARDDTPGGDDSGTGRLAVRFSELTAATKAAALRVDPLADREEYNGLLRILDDAAGRQQITEFVDRLDRDEDPVGHAVAQRIQNLGILDWDVWARDDPSLLDLVRTRPRAVVMDVADCKVPQERSVAAAALLDHLWAHRNERDPVLVVIDEAHNLCPAEPTEPVQRLVTERLAQIAAEGRKYGLWLLLSTQQPSKVHPLVLSQCDNLVLMRMNSSRDIRHLHEVFGTAPPQMLAAAPFLSKGELVLAGGFVAAPMIATVSERVTQEGGSDISVPLVR